MLEMFVIRYTRFCNLWILQKQKSKYLKNETLFFLQIKKIINYTSRTPLFRFLEGLIYAVFLTGVENMGGGGLFKIR